MSLDQAIRHGKEKRRPYRRSEAFDRSCRPHGGCGYCQNNRLYCDRRRRAAAEEQLRAYLEGDDGAEEESNVLHAEG